MSFETGDRGGAPTGLGIWVHALRAPFLTASVLPALVGSAAAYWQTGSLALGRLVAGASGVACFHLGANLANDYSDWVTGCDALNPEPTPFSGGSRMIQRGLLSSKAIVAACCLFFALGTLLGIWLNSAVNGIAPGNKVLWLGLAGLAGGIAYSVAPLRLSYRGVGEFVVFALFGPLAVAGNYLCQTGRLGAFPIMVSVPAGLLVLAILLANEVLDVKWDGLAGKRTLVVRLGRRRGYLFYLVTYLGAYAWVAAGIFLGIYPVVAVVALAPLVFLRRLLPGNALRDRTSTIGASRLTILSHTFTASVIAASYFLGRRF